MVAAEMAGRILEASLRRTSPRRTRFARALCASAIVAVLSMLATACGDDVNPTTEGGGPKGPGEPTTVTKTLSWDFSRGAGLTGIRWPATGTAFESRRGIQVNVTFPTGKAFRGRVDKVSGRREGSNIRNLDLYFPAESTDDAYKRAQRLAKEWNIDLANIDQWHKRRKEQRAKGKEDLSYTSFTGSTDGKQLGDAKGPRPALEMLNSFDRERPVAVNLSFLWPRPGQR